MMKHSLHTLLMAFTAIVLAACSGEKFHVEGTITDATDSTLYFENISLEGVVTLDSTRLSADGSFAFSGERPEAPDFYRLRIGGQAINVSIDSTETVTIRASYPTMASDYTVEGSDECVKIKELAVMQLELQRKVIALENNHSIDAEAAQATLLRYIADYKARVKNDYIYKQPQATSSYFALFQTLGRTLIFNPRADADDIKAFGAVASSWDTFHPGALRTENLHNITLESMKNDRIVADRNQPIDVDESKVVTAGLIDIALPDNKGHERSLTQLRGKVVMLDFHLFAMKESTARILMLRELYTKYHERGLEIFQVSLDPDEHFWKQQTAALPWVSVRDADGLDSRYAASYNVQRLPEYFLIDRDNNLVSRSQQIKSLEEEIEKLL